MLILVYVYLAFTLSYCKINTSMKWNITIFDFNVLNLLPGCMFFTPTRKLKRLV